MAVDGTTVPEDAARPNHIPSKARPGQGDGGVGQEGLGAADLASAADNQGDIARVSRRLFFLHFIGGKGGVESWVEVL